ncbi:hypothetical protein [Spartinivicinus ruber]|uniref:hypothetical protein n=1 Tax=Spartinivicinus ruber TaxID=2683272 RepID=UPI0013D5D712|nr:hypothetical protein [Spartinivicinus ruber]
MRFRITKDNYMDAYLYLKDQLDKTHEPKSIGHHVKYDWRSPHVELSTPDQELERCSPVSFNIFPDDAPDELQKWCEKYLEKQHWTRLRGAIRARQKRRKDEEAREQKKNVTLSRRAYYKLVEMSKELSETDEPLTLSDTIIEAEELLFQAGHIKAPWDE